MPKCKSCGAELAPDTKFCVECGVQLDIAQTQDQTAYQTEMQAQQNLQTDDQFEHNSDKTSAQFQQEGDNEEEDEDDDKKNINIAQRIIYYAALIISVLGSLLYDVLTSISFSKPKKRPTVAKVITTILIGIGDFIFLVICYLWLENLVEDKLSVPIADELNILLKVLCLYPLHYLLLFIISVLNLVPTVIYIFISSKRRSFTKAYSKCFKYFKPVIGLLCSIFAYGFLIVVSILG